MTLPQIDQRLTLFSEYLKYRVEAKSNSFVKPLDTFRLFKEHGIMYVDKHTLPLMSFDLWLVDNGYSELTICLLMDDYPKITTIEQQRLLKQIFFN